MAGDQDGRQPFRPAVTARPVTMAKYSAKKSKKKRGITAPFFINDQRWNYCCAFDYCTLYCCPLYYCPLYYCTLYCCTVIAIPLFTGSLMKANLAPS